MKKIFVYILSITGILIGLMVSLGIVRKFDDTEYLMAIQVILVPATLVVMFFQIRISFHYNKRKAAIDFCYQQIQNTLFPLCYKLKQLLNKDLLIFEEGETIGAFLKEENVSSEVKKEVLKLSLDILNFYERMAIAIFKGIYDEDVCYDDTGFTLIQFYKWSKNYIIKQQLKTDERVFINFQEIAERWKRRYDVSKDTHKKYVAKIRQKRTIANKSI